MVHILNGIKFRAHQAAGRVAAAAIASLPASLRRRLMQPKRHNAKQYWSTKPSACNNAERFYTAIGADQRHLRNVLEFGCNWGGNLFHFLERQPSLRVVGIDVNANVLKAAEQTPQFCAIVGDESTLTSFHDGSFDLAFTISVLDHLPSDTDVEETIQHLVRIAQTVVLVEPFVEGVHRDVSGLTRNEVKSGLERGDKRFASYCYLWNYDAMLNRLDVTWEKRPFPLHTSSLGPFYHLYQIERGRSSNHR